MPSKTRSETAYSRLCVLAGGRRKRLQAMGVRVSETSPETRTATPIVAANSWSNRPITPPMKKTGMNTAARDRVMDRMVNPISLDPSSAASIRVLPSSICRTMFSSMTMASSTTKPTDSVRAIKERLSTVYPNRYMAAKVPTIDMGRARLGMIVAETFRRKRKITRMTSMTARSSVNSTSRTDSRMEIERSYRMLRLTDAGIWARKVGSNVRIASTTSTVFVPGCR